MRYESRCGPLPTSVLIILLWEIMPRVAPLMPPLLIQLTAIDLSLFLVAWLLLRRSMVNVWAIMTNSVFPPPRVFQKLYSLVKRDFTKYYQSGYSETPQITGTGLEREVVKLLEEYAPIYNYHVHLTDKKQKRGFAGLLHKFDAGIEEKSDLSQCLFEVKYRGVDGIPNQTPL